MRRKKSNTQVRIIRTQDEKLFFQMIERRMKQKGFDCVETFSSLSKRPSVNEPGYRFQS